MAIAVVADHSNRLRWVCEGLANSLSREVHSQILDVGIHSDVDNENMYVVIRRKHDAASFFIKLDVYPWRYFYRPVHTFPPTSEINAKIILFLST